MFNLWCACSQVVNTLVANFNDSSNNVFFSEVPFYGFDFDSSVEMLAVAVVLFTFTLLFLALIETAPYGFRIALRGFFATVVTAAAFKCAYIPRLDANCMPQCGATSSGELGVPHCCL